MHAQVSGRRRCRRSRRARTTGRRWPAGWLRRKRRIRPQPGERRLGPFLRALASSSRSTTCGSAIRRRIPRLLDALGAEAGGVRLRHQAAGSRHLQLANLSALHARATNRTPGTSGIFRTAASAGCGPKCCWTASTRSPKRAIAFRDCRKAARAVQIADGRTPNYFLTTFGRSTRQTPCTCEVKTSPTLSQALHLINGETTSGKIAEGQVDRETAGRTAAIRWPSSATCTSAACRGSRRQQEAAAIQAKLAAASDVPGGAGRSLLGAAQLERVLVQPLAARESSLIESR